MDLKKVKPTKLLWLDLEMTGLDTNRDLILEVAAEVTDFDFKTLGSFEARIRHPRASVVERMQKNSWWADFPENREDFLNRLDEGVAMSDAEVQLMALVQLHFGREPAVLAGNSIWNDRNFIRRWWPRLDLKLHYRMLDVSSFKILMQGKYATEFEKKDVHRAFDDIQASVAELQYYLGKLKSE
jgi:oligoribonuclease